MRITLATIKSFIRKNRESLLINCKSSFDGMVDCVMPTDENGFTKALNPDEGRNFENCLGIHGAWFVLGGGDRFYPYEDESFKGYEVYNCCGRFILATSK
jgi:hypothetical protein